MDNTNIKIIPDTIENRNKVSQFINLWDDNFPNSLRKFYNFYEGLPIDKPELEWKCFIFGNGEKPRGFTPFKSPIVGISNYFMVYGTYIFTDIRKHIHSMGWALLNNDVISLDIHPEGVQVKAKQKFLVSLDNINNIILLKAILTMVIYFIRALTKLILMLQIVNFITIELKFLTLILIRGLRDFLILNPLSQYLIFLMGLCILIVLFIHVLERL